MKEKKMSQIETDINELASESHAYRKILILTDFKTLTRPFKDAKFG
jgi:hypothetical protein